MIGGEDISGVPLGLSRDYDRLSRAAPLRDTLCLGCWGRYEDGERLTADGCRVIALMCGDCRSRGRERWIEEHRAPLPTAIVRGAR